PVLTLSLHDALPICLSRHGAEGRPCRAATATHGENAGSRIVDGVRARSRRQPRGFDGRTAVTFPSPARHGLTSGRVPLVDGVTTDRKSTRLNSSHDQ